MKVRSDTKRKEIDFSKFKNVFNDFESFHQSWTGTIIIYLLLTIGAYFLWESYALYAVTLHIISGVFIVDRKDRISGKVIFSGLVLGMMLLLAAANVFNMKKYNTTNNVKYEKIEFIDSTEKVIIKATSPIKKTLVFDNVTTNEYYSIRNSNDINISIICNPNSDYYDMKKNIISEYDYFYTINYDGKIYKTKTFKKSKPLF